MLRRSRQRLICATRDNTIFESLNDLGKNIYPPIYEKPNHRYCPWMNSIIIEEEKESIVEILKIKSQYTCSRILRWSKKKIYPSIFRFPKIRKIRRWIGNFHPSHFLRRYSREKERERRQTRGRQLTQTIKPSKRSA